MEETYDVVHVEGGCVHLLAASVTQCQNLPSTGIFHRTSLETESVIIGHAYELGGTHTTTVTLQLLTSVSKMSQCNGGRMFQIRDLGFDHTTRHDVDAVGIPLRIQFRSRRTILHRMDVTRPFEMIGESVAPLKVYETLHDGQGVRDTTYLRTVTTCDTVRYVASACDHYPTWITTAMSCGRTVRGTCSATYALTGQLRDPILYV